MPVPLDKRPLLLARLDALIAKGSWQHPAAEARKSRPAYLKLISDYGFDLADVEGPHTGQSEEECLNYAFALFKLLEDDPNGLYAPSIAWSAHSAITGESNDNFLLDDDVRRLKSTGNILASPLPDFEVGIFPMYSSNAEIQNCDGIKVILLDTGLLKIIRLFCTVLLGNIPEIDKVPLLCGCIDEYVKNRNFVPVDYEAVHLSSESDKWGLFIVNEYQAACRQFLVAHELAHFVMNHDRPNESVDLGLRDGRKLEGYEKTELTEFEADASAINLLLASAFYLPVKSLAQRRRNILHAIAGPAAVFSISLMMEFARRRHGVAIRAGHPHTSLRIAQLYRIVSIYRQTEHAWLAQRATELAHVCCEAFYAEEVDQFRTHEVSEVSLAIMDNIIKNLSLRVIPRPEYDAQGGIM